jgi:hypothetical protein
MVRSSRSANTCLPRVFEVFQVTVSTTAPLLVSIFCADSSPYHFTVV